MSTFHLWALDRLGDDAGKVTVNPISSEHPVEFVDGMPTKDDQFNCATKFQVELGFEDGLKILVADRADDKGFDNGIMFEGEKGRYFVNRGKLTGKAGRRTGEESDQRSDDEIALRQRKGSRRERG